MENIKFYEINATYIDYLKPYAPHLFHNRREGQVNERKYIGVILQVRGNDYFAPLSSFKPKHQRMKEGLDFIKVRHYAPRDCGAFFVRALNAKRRLAL